MRQKLLEIKYAELELLARMKEYGEKTGDVFYFGAEMHELTQSLSRIDHDVQKEDLLKKHKLEVGQMIFGKNKEGNWIYGRLRNISKLGVLIQGYMGWFSEWTLDKTVIPEEDKKAILAKQERTKAIEIETMYKEHMRRNRGGLV